MTSRAQARLDDRPPAQDKSRSKMSRAKLVLEASQVALDAQNKQQEQARHATRLDISNLFGQQSYTLPADQTPDRKRSSTSPRLRGGAPMDHESTRKSLATDLSAVDLSHRQRRGALDLGNRSAARAVAANLDGTKRVRAQQQQQQGLRDASVHHLLAGSRSERVRRMSQAKGAANGSSRKDPTLEMLEQDERNFIAEIPVGFQPSSPPTCEAPKRRPHRQYTDNARIPIELDDFGGEGYLLRK